MSNGVSELSGLGCWLSNPTARGIIFEYMSVRYFTATPSLEGGYAYTCWIENLNNALVPQLYFSVDNTYADMTLAPGNPVQKGSATVYTQTELQTINWHPFTESPRTDEMVMRRSNVVTYERRLYVPSNSVRVVLKDFYSVRRNLEEVPRDLMMGATLFFHWVR